MGIHRTPSIMKSDMEIRKISKEEIAKMSDQEIIDKAREYAKAMGFNGSLATMSWIEPKDPEVVDLMDYLMDPYSFTDMSLRMDIFTP